MLHWLVLYILGSCTRLKCVFSVEKSFMFVFGNVVVYK